MDGSEPIAEVQLSACALLLAAKIDHVTKGIDLTFYRKPEDVGKSIPWTHFDLMILNAKTEDLLKTIYETAMTTNGYAGQYMPTDMVAAKVVSQDILSAYLSHPTWRADPSFLAKPNKPRKHA